MNRLKKIGLLMILTSIFTLSGCTGAGSGSGTALKDLSDSGLISAVSGTAYDWGDINIKGGEMKHSFTLKNEGSEDLILKSAVTSCMCTKARYRLPDNKISPSFGMHNNTHSWSAPIKPGETFDMEVTFDPMAHGPTATGPIQRSIKLETSSKKNPIFELEVSGNVLSEKDFKEKNK